MRRSASTAPECRTSLNALLLIGSIPWLANGLLPGLMLLDSRNLQCMPYVIGPNPAETQRV